MPSVSHKDLEQLKLADLPFELGESIGDGGFACVFESSGKNL
jgi:hypothetical protein